MVCFIWFGAMLWTVLQPTLLTRSSANHTSCRQYDGSEGNDNFTGYDLCDEIWMYGGVDTVYGRDGGDDIHMGGGTDIAHGEGGSDDIWGGDNPTSSEEALRGGADADEIIDSTGPDWDLACGGDFEDYISLADGDGQLDRAYGGVNENKEDVFNGDTGDYNRWYADGSC